MKDMSVVERLRGYLRKSAFNKQGYTVNVELSDMYRSLRFYFERHSNDIEDQEIISKMTPEFQRSNDKWNLQRKIKYVENILCGYQSEIKLFTVNNDLLDDCQIIDGLQRLTALDDWFKNKFKVFGEFYYSDFKDSPKRAPFVDARLTMCIHRFGSLKEAVQYYIDINEGISHSEADIIKAIKYLESL